jgi:serine/threonine protein kinase
MVQRPQTRYQLQQRDPPGANVFRGRDRLTGRLVAIKCADMENNGDGPCVNTLRELGTLQHLKGQPSIVELKAAPRVDDALWLVFERMDTNLRQPPRDWIVPKSQRAAMLLERAAGGSSSSGAAGGSGEAGGSTSGGEAMEAASPLVAGDDDCAAGDDGAGDKAADKIAGKVAAPPSSNPSDAFSAGADVEMVPTAMCFDDEHSPPSLDEDVPLRPETLRLLMWQLLQGVDCAHSKSCLHRDIKPDNLLVEHRTGRLVIAGWGLSRAITIPVGQLTHEVVTLWYRAPEILLGGAHYSMPVDMWSVGAVFAELAKGTPLFPSDNMEIDQIMYIFQALGTPTDEVWQGVSHFPDYQACFPKFKRKPLRELVPQLCDQGLDLLDKLLQYDPAKRISARAALSHPYFNGPAGAGTRHSWQVWPRCRDVRAEMLRPALKPGAPTPPQDVETAGLLEQPAKTRRQ